MNIGIVVSNEASKHKEELRLALPSYLLHFANDLEVLSCPIRSGRVSFVVFSIDVTYFNFHLFFTKIKTLYTNIPAFLINTDSTNGIEILEIEGYIGYKISEAISLDDNCSNLINIIQSLPVRDTKIIEHRIKKVYNTLIGSSQNVEALRYFVFNAAKNDLPVVLHGATGCGKNLVAQLIHEISSRASEKFVSLDIGTISLELMESELFGVKKGAFTGAYTDKPGLIEEANNGTLFLDEIENAPISLQMKLLRVLETKKIRAVGDTVEKSVNFRLICATNRSLKKMVRENGFRRDLYYRILGQYFTILPLRYCKEDIAELARYFCKKNNFTITEAAINKLLMNQWKGNVRELFNVLSRAFIEASPMDVLLPEHIRFF